MGYSSFTANNLSDIILINKQSNVDSSNPKNESESNFIKPVQNNYNITEEEAVKIAFKEAKKYEDTYNLIINDNTVASYTCEIKQKDGIVLYDIIFKNISLKNHADDIKTQIEIWVNVDSGEIAEVVQYK